MRYPVYKPQIHQSDKLAVMKCLDSTWISSKGEFIEKFENAFSKYIGVNHSVSVSNGTVALDIAVRALNIGPGDEVIVPTFTYISSVNAITYSGATPIFCDSESEYWQIDHHKIEKLISNKTKAIMVVHLYGHPCNMQEIMKIANKYKLKVIEDCAEALGSEFSNQKVGSFGDVATFSFFGNKTITTGEGGMACTNSHEIATKLSMLKGQGLSPEIEYWHTIVGYNYRMTNICASIGYSQLKRIDDVIDKKIQIANQYNTLLAESPVKTQKTSIFCKNTYWMNSILLSNASDRNPMRKHLKSHGIETRPLFYCIDSMPMYKNGFSKNRYPNARFISSRGINLPSYPDLKHEDIKFITSRIKDYFSS